MANEEGVAEAWAVAAVAVTVATVAVLLMFLMLLLISAGAWFMTSIIKDLDSLSLVS